MAIHATKVTCLHPPLRSIHAAKRPLRLIRMRSVRHFDAIVQIRFTRCWRKLSRPLHSASGLRRMSRARGVFAAKRPGPSESAAKRPCLSNPSDLARAQEVKMYSDACIHTRAQPRNCAHAQLRTRPVCVQWQWHAVADAALPHFVQNAISRIRTLGSCLSC